MGLIGPKKKSTNWESRKRQIRRADAWARAHNIDLHGKPDKFIGGKISRRAEKPLVKIGQKVKRTKRGPVLVVERQYAKRIYYREKDKAIVRDFGNRRTVSYPFDDSPATLARIERFFKHRPKNAYLTMRVGDAAPFDRHIRSMADFERYYDQLVAEWEERAEHEDERKREDNPQAQLRVVEIYGFEILKPKGKKRGPRKTKKA